MIENTTKGESMDKERIAEIKARWSTGPAHDKGGETERTDIREVHELLDAIESANAEIERLRADLATVTAERDAGMVEVEGMTDDAYRLGLPLTRFYGLITEHMRTEGGIPMTDALGAGERRLKPPASPPRLAVAKGVRKPLL